MQSKKENEIENKQNLQDTLLELKKVFASPLLAESILNKTLLIELKHLQKFCPAGIYIIPQSDNIKIWHGIIFPREGIYRDGIFKYQIHIPPDYPNSPPDVYCKTNIYHMNINKSGKVCVQSITEDDKWQIRHDISTVLLSIFIIFDKPNPSSPYQSEIAKLYLNNIEEYKKNVKENCEKYAIKIPE